MYRTEGPKPQIQPRQSTKLSGLTITSSSVRWNWTYTQGVVQGSFHTYLGLYKITQDLTNHKCANKRVIFHVHVFQYHALHCIT